MQYVKRVLSCRSVRKVVAVSVASVALCGCMAIQKPLTGPQVAGFAAELKEKIQVPAIEMMDVLTVDGAIAMAIDHNQDLRARELETVMSEAKVLVESGRLLPGIVAESRYYKRDRPQSSHSSQSPAYTTSSDLGSTSRDITLSWNILDFGLSYVRTKQGIDKVHQLREQTRLVGGRIAEETRTAFWRAVALEKMRPGLAGLAPEVDAAMALARQASQDSKIDPMPQITFQRELLGLQRELNQLHTSIAGAGDELRQLTGSQGVERLELDSSRNVSPSLVPSASADADIIRALNQRPEVRQHMYDLRITKDEIDATILQALPGVTLSQSFSSDSNSFLLNSNWISWGTKIAGNLMRLALVGADLEVVDSQARFQRQSALATAATIVMQVHVARARLAVQQQAHSDSERSATTQRQLLAQVQASVKSGKTGRQALTREKMETLLAEVRADLAFADLQGTLAGYATAIGELPNPAFEPSSPVLVPPAMVVTNQRPNLSGAMP